MLRHGPRSYQYEGFANKTAFEAPSHGFTNRCLRLKTPFPVANQGSLSVNGQFLPSGSQTRRVSIETFRYFFLFSFHCFFSVSYLPVSPGFGWRQVSSALPPLQTSELWNDFHAAMETPQSFDELQSPPTFPPPFTQERFRGRKFGTRWNSPLQYIKYELPPRVSLTRFGT